MLQPQWIVQNYNKKAHKKNQKQEYQEEQEYLQEK